jgi:uncharacterized coiled-coil protein SlyX
MPTLDERVAFLEGTVTENGKRVDELRALVVQLDARVDKRLRFDTVDRRFVEHDRRFSVIEAQIGALDRKMSRQFQWLMGTLVALLIAVVSTLLGVVVTLE